MVTITNHSFTSEMLEVGYYLSLFRLEGELTLANANVGDELWFTAHGFGFNDGSIVVNKVTGQEVARIYLMRTFHDPDLSHTSDNPQTSFLREYKMVITEAVPDDTVVYVRYEGQDNHSISKQDYDLVYSLSQGTGSAMTPLHTKTVRIPRRTPEEESNSFLSLYTNVTYVEGEWDGRRVAGTLWGTVSTIPSGSLFEIIIPQDHMHVTETMTVGRRFQAGSQPYATENSPVNSYGVYQQDPNPLEFEVVSVAPDKVILKNLRDTLPYNKYAINLEDSVWINDLRYVYELEDIRIPNVAQGDIKSPDGRKLTNSENNIRALTHLRTKKNSSADTPYKEPTAPPPPPVLDEPQTDCDAGVFINPTGALEKPPCMDCDTCSNCACEPAEVLTSNTSTQIMDKLRVILDTVCSLSDTSCLDLPKFLGKVLFLLWCILQDLLAQILCLYHRTKVLRCRDKEVISKLLYTIDQLNADLAIQNENNKLLLKYISDVSAGRRASQPTIQTLASLNRELRELSDFSCGD